MAFYFPFIDGRTCNQITTPLVYDESLSVAQQIACIFGRLKQIDDGFLSVEDFQKFLKRLNIEQAQQTSDLKSYTDTEVENLDNDLRNLIAGMQIGMMLWDVTQGRYNDNVASMRNIFNDVTVHAITVDTLADLDITVDGLAESGLNVRGLAVFSGYLVGEDFVPEGVTYDGPPAIDGKITCAILANGEVRDGYFVEGR